MEIPYSIPRNPQIKSVSLVLKLNRVSTDQGSISNDMPNEFLSDVVLFLFTTMSIIMQRGAHFISPEVSNKRVRGRHVCGRGEDQQTSTQIDRRVSSEHV